MILIGGAVFGGYIIASKNSPSQGKAVTQGVQRRDLLVCPLDGSTVNLSDEGGKRYVKVKVSLGYEKNDKLTKELGANKDIVTDSIISVIRSKKSEEMDAAHEKMVKDNIKTKVNSTLINGQIEEIYFVEILIQ